MADRNNRDRRKNLGLESSHGPNPDPDAGGSGSGSTNVKTKNKVGRSAGARNSGIIDSSHGSFDQPAPLDYDTALAMWRFGSLYCGSVDGQGSTGSGLSNIYTPPANVSSEFSGPVHGKGAYVDDGECDCSKEHPFNFSCPNRPYLCNICCKSHHHGRCPYLDHLPRGATFNNNGYKIMCVCGNEFIEEKWTCTACGGSWAVLKDKFCIICNGRYQHNSDECPKDKVLAAQYKVVTDELRSRVPIPYMPESSSPGMAYTPSSSWGSGYKAVLYTK